MWLKVVESGTKLHKFVIGVKDNHYVYDLLHRQI